MKSIRQNTNISVLCVITLRLCVCQCLCVCMCVCVHALVCECACVRVSVYVCTCVHVRVRVCLCVCVWHCVCVCFCTCASVWIFNCLYIYTYIPHTYVYGHIHTVTHTRIHVYVYIHMTSITSNAGEKWYSTWLDCNSPFCASTEFLHGKNKVVLHIPIVQASHTIKHLEKQTQLNDRKPDLNNSYYYDIHPEESKIESLDSLINGLVSVLTKDLSCKQKNQACTLEPRN